jgi:hypothetical protein
MPRISEIFRHLQSEVTKRKNDQAAVKPKNVPFDQIYAEMKQELGLDPDAVYATPSSQQETPLTEEEQALELIRDLGYELATRPNTVLNFPTHNDGWYELLVRNDQYRAANRRLESLSTDLKRVKISLDYFVLEDLHPSDMEKFLFLDFHYSKSLTVSLHRDPNWKTTIKAFVAEHRLKFEHQLAKKRTAKK